MTALALKCHDRQNGQWDTSTKTSFGIANELKDYIIQQHVLDSDGEFPASPNARHVGGTSAIPDLEQLALTYTCGCCRTMGHNATECFKVRSIGYKVTKLEGNSNVSPDHSNNQGGRGSGRGGGGRGRGGGNSTNSCGNSGNSNNNSTPAPTATNSSSNTNPTTSSQSNNSTSSES
jgi:hypothetical protein